ncbi:hypothetical protein BDC45DRAFT_493674 [Circinella umbellata]|nr:hypothetical protein BDC45DRAFT_493674 [Circinella umbellata]
MGSYFSDEEQRQQQQQQQQQQAAPRIKLKLRLNSSSNDASIVTSTANDNSNNNNNIVSPTEDRKRKKHKKKKSHKKHKRQKKNQDSDDEETFQQQRTHQHGRRRHESEQLDIDDDDNDHNLKALSSTPPPSTQQRTHMPVGGKRPFAYIQAEQNNQEDDDHEEDDYDDMGQEQQSNMIKQEEEESIPASTSSTTFDDYSYQQHRHHHNENHGRNTIHERSVHPTERSAHHYITTANRPTTIASSSKQINTTRTATPPSRQRTASISTTTSASEHKPKKRGRPAKVKAPPPKPEPRPPPEPVKKDRDLKSIATKLLDTLERRDSYGLFLQPVDTTIITDYLTVIKHPMDFATMRKKLNSDEYSDMEDFRQDFLLICTNAKTYNAPDTIYYRNADRLEHYGLKAIDRAAKTVVYESSERADTPFSDHSTATTTTTTTAGGGGGGYRWGSISGSLTAQQRRRASSISTTLTGGKRDSNVKMEEEVDILGLDNGGSIYPTQQQRKASRQQQQYQYYQQQQDLDGMMVDTASSSRAGTPVRAFGIPTMTKKKKKKMTEAGIVYASDGSLAGVGAVSDLQTLIPSEERFSEVPGITMVNTHALPSAFYTTRSSYEEWSSNKHPIHPAHFADYGAFTALGNEPPGAFYTAQDACYIYPLYGDDRGEAYMRSLWEFAEETGDDELTKTIYEKSNYLTRGAWNVLQESLKDINDVKDVNAEFGSLHVSEFKKAYESVTQQQQ